MALWHTCALKQGLDQCRARGQRVEFVSDVAIGERKNGGMPALMAMNIFFDNFPVTRCPSIFPPPSYF